MLLRPPVQRRAALALLATASLPLRAQPVLATRVVPSTGERIPAVGLGSWITFNVGRDRALRDNAIAVMKAFFDGGRRLVDSSPMYGSSQEVIGEGLARLARSSSVFAAGKVWTGSAAAGVGQIEATRRFLGPAAVRPAAGAQPVGVARAPGDAARQGHAGRAPAALCRRHHLARPASW